MSPSLTRAAVATLIAAIATATVYGIRATPVIGGPLRRLDDTFYNAMYQHRPIERDRTSDVVIVLINQSSLDDVQDSPDTVHYGLGWPWPWRFYGSMLEYLLEDCHARAVVFDAVFNNTSTLPPYEGKTNEQWLGEAIDRARSTTGGGLVFAANATEDRKPFKFRVPTTRPVDMGAANVGGEAAIWKKYLPYVYGQPSLAVATLRSAKVPSRLDTDRPLLLHFYGPYVDAAGRHTFTYVNAADVLHLSYGDNGTWKADPEMFRDKIVLIGAGAIGLNDNKDTPLSNTVPGVEIQATAVQNLLNGDEVTPVGPASTVAVTALFAWLAALAVTLPPRTELKVALGVAVAATLFVLGFKLFALHHIIWLPMAAPVVALLVSTLGAFAWSYFGENRQQRRLLKALSSVVSPHVAEELSRDPRRLAIGGQRREMTVMFSDIAGFTDMSETLPPEKLAPLLSFYLEEMSGVVLGQSGTLDKYIGDAIMSFWNAPLPQEDHAARACRAALRMAACERAMQPALRERGAGRIMTRVGINSGPMAVGFTGSSHLMNYTVIGDAVNLASRLEGANKMYGTQLMASENTAALVRDQFVLRKLDVVRVKGKLQPMAVYELIAEGQSDEATRRKIDLYERALAHYRAQRWDEAERILLELARDFPDDGPTKTLYNRVAHFRQSPPAEDWDGVYVAKEK